jgi:hypothetical protein
MMHKDPVKYNQKRIFIGTDSQSCLTAMNPLKKPKFGKLDPTAPLKAYLDAAREHDSTMYLQWIPSHTDLPGNTEADEIANAQRFHSSFQDQLQCQIAPASLKTFLRQHETRAFHSRVLLENKGHAGWRFATCHFSRSNFEQRRQCPRALQTLFSRYRMGSVDSCGSYPRHLGYIPRDSPCRFCTVAKETPSHLLNSCPGTAAYRILFGLSPTTLLHDTPSNLLAIALFDDYITMVHPIEQNRYQHRLTQAMVTFLDRKRDREPSTPDLTSSTSPVEPTAKRQRIFRRPPRRRLIIPSSTTSPP